MNICTSKAKTMVGETFGTLAGVWTVAPSWTSSHRILYHRAPVLKEKVSHKNVFDEAETIINFTKPQPSSPCFLISQGTKWEVGIKHFCTASMTVAFRESTSAIVWLVGRTRHTCHRIPRRNSQLTGYSDLTLFFFFIRFYLFI